VSNVFGSLVCRSALQLPFHLFACSTAHLLCERMSLTSL